MRGTRQLCDGDADADLRRDGHQVTEEGCGNLSQLKNLHGGLHAHVDKQDVQHSAAMKVGDLRNNQNMLSLTSLRVSNSQS